MDVKEEIDVKDEPLDFEEEDVEKNQFFEHISGLDESQRMKFFLNLDIKDEVEIKHEPLEFCEEELENGQVFDQISGLDESQTLISDVDLGEKDVKHEEKDPLRNFQQTSGGQNLKIEKEDIEEPSSTTSSLFNIPTLREHLKSEIAACHFLQEKNIFPKSKKCKNNHDMKLNPKGSNKIVWRCSKKICRYEISVRKDTWFEGTKLELRTIILFIYCWCKEETSAMFCKKQFNIHKSTTVDYNNFLREVCAYSIINDCQSIGGENMIVEVDETFLSKRKNQKGRVLPSQWVFGGICRESKELFLFSVPNRSEEKLFECIKEKIKPKTTIISDCLKSYINIEKIPGFDYKHIQINHSKNIIHPISGGAHTQNIENTWFLLKRRNKKHCGIHRQMLDSYLCEFVWRTKFSGKDLFLSMLKCISEFKVT
ncbi:UNVERIFIED_CONTAM: hypothetical protein RMT77_014508 [Armadillidium vulgare]